MLTTILSSKYGQDPSHIRDVSNRRTPKITEAPRKRKDVNNSSIPATAETPATAEAPTTALYYIQQGSMPQQGDKQLQGLQVSLT